jgi:predicted RNA-binding Zn ribbon-like protein
MPNQNRNIQTLDFFGGAMCLDFVNTINSRTAPEFDYLRDYAHFADWSGRAGIASADQCSRLKSLASQDANQAHGVFVKALHYREIIYQLFRKIARNIEPDPVELRLFLHLYSDALVHGEMTHAGNHFIIEWQSAADLESPMWPILNSAAQILFSAELAHVKECPGCGWLFLDRSKNQSRKWCSMETCGARDKTRRYQKKQLAGKP